MGMDTTMPPHMMAMETTMLPDLTHASPSSTTAKADDLLTSNVNTSTTETNKLMETTNEGETSLPMTTIEPIMTTEPTTTPTLSNEHTMMQHEHDHHQHQHHHTVDEEDHIQRISGHHSHDHQHEHANENVNIHVHTHDNGVVHDHEHHLLPSTTSTTSTTKKLNEIEPQTEEHINQISAEVEDDVKDFNNFRHPATLITASQSDETLNTGDKDNSKSLEEHEDPYHAHILSENHDRLAEHEDYQMLSSTEETLDATTTSSSTSTTTTTTPKPFLETHTDEIVVSNENEATAKPLMHNDTTEGRARAINMDDDDEGSTLTTSTTAATPVEPAVSIVEGNHYHMHEHHDEHPQEQHHMNVHIENQDDHMTSSTTEKPHEMPAVFVFNGEGRSVDSSISAENDDNLSPLNYHYNFVTTQRNHNEHEEKNSAYKDLSDVSMDEDDEDRYQKTHEHLHEHNNGEHHNHFAINENTKEMMTTTTNANSQQNDSMTYTTSAPIAGKSTTTITSETLTEPQMKITEITAAGDTMHRECLADGKSFKVSFTMNNHVSE